MPKKAAVTDQRSLFEALEPFDDGRGLSADATSTFARNLGLPVHRWFRYSAGFSAAWVSEVIEKEKANGRSNVLDPFVGFWDRCAGRRTMRN